MFWSQHGGVIRYLLVIQEMTNTCKNTSIR